MRKSALILGLFVIVMFMILPSLAKATESLAIESDKLEGAPPVYLPHFIYQPLLPFMNGDFESGPVYWTPDLPNGASRPLIYEVNDLPIAPYSGNWMAWFENEGVEGPYYLTQEITIPPEATHLSFWHWDDFPSTCGNEVGVSVQLCGSYLFISTCSPQWRNTLIDVSSCTGQLWNFKIGMDTYGGSSPETLFIDKIEFIIK